MTSFSKYIFAKLKLVLKFMKYLSFATSQDIINL